MNVNKPRNITGGELVDIINAHGLEDFELFTDVAFKVGKDEVLVFPCEKPREVPHLSEEWGTVVSNKALKGQDYDINTKRWKKSWEEDTNRCNLANWYSHESHIPYQSERDLLRRCSSSF